MVGLAGDRGRKAPQCGDCTQAWARRQEEGLLRTPWVAGGDRRHYPASVFSRSVARMSAEALSLSPSTRLLVRQVLQQLGLFYQELAVLLDVDEGFLRAWARGIDVETPVNVFDAPTRLRRLAVIGDQWERLAEGRGMPRSAWEYTDIAGNGLLHRLHEAVRDGTAVDGLLAEVGAYTTPRPPHPALAHLPMPPSDLELMFASMKHWEGERSSEDG